MSNAGWHGSVDLAGLLNNICAGDIPVDGSGVVRYASRSLKRSLPESMLFLMTLSLRASLAVVCHPLDCNL